MLKTSETWRRISIPLGAAALLIILFLQLALSIRQQSQTWDEGDHIYAGYMSWRGDHGLNPEHPPLVKLLATAPLLSLPLKLPSSQIRFFKEEAFLNGKEFLYRNDAELILFRARLAASALTILLALLVFLATKEMFGTCAAFVALTLLVFEPNLLAHGALVTTDAGFSCFLFATVYLFYRYVKKPSIWRLVLVGISAGLALATKHTGIFVFPILLLLAIFEIGRVRTSKHALRLAGSLAVTTLMAVAILWAFYGFRYESRPRGLQLTPALAEYAQLVKPHEAWIVNTFARGHVLPESYLIGLVDVKVTADFYTSFLFGKTYAHSVWFYFPAAFLIKSTIAFLALLLLTLIAIATRLFNGWREIVFLIIPPAFYLIVAMSAGSNIGVRHILPLYVFFAVLIGGAASALMQSKKQWIYVVVVLLLLHAISSLRTFPVYVAYANELFGGPSNVHKHLSDSNADWAQQLKSTSRYLKERGVKDCWFVYFAEGVAETSYYGIPCKPLPTVTTLWLNEQMDVPPTVDGPVLISAANLSGFEFGPGSLNPYEEFKQRKPSAVIDYSVFVFDGRFDIPLASALVRIQKAQNLLAEKQLDQALAEAQAAVALAPEAIQPRLTLGDIMKEMGRVADARSEYEKALSLARTIEPEFQIRSVPSIEQRLAEN